MPTTASTRLHNFIGGKAVPSASSRSLPVTAPATGEVLAEVPLSTASELDAAVKAASGAQKDWAEQTLRQRVQVFYRLKTVIEQETGRLAEVIHRENGKTIEEAKASVARAVECIEFATSLPQTALGQVLEVSRGIECKLYRYPLGVTAGITPFNFPFMVPLWMAPMSIALGNAFVLKPSEQTPLSSLEIARCFEKAGLPAGLFSVVHGDREIVEAICDHPEIRAVGFVGSTRIAKTVHQRATAAGKRVRALGGAKNHLIVMPDADVEMTVSNVIASVTGCAGQRCMAASVLIAVGNTGHIVDTINERIGKLRGGRDFGAVISRKALERISGYVDRAPSGGARVPVDGRNLVEKDLPPDGNYIGPSVIDHARADHEAVRDEIFGPTLTVVRCRNLDEALAVEQASPYGNAAAIYTSSGATAQYFADRVSAGMIGVNIGVPVPREPFPFGGWNESSFGDGDITGFDAIDFWTKAKKITTKWSDQFRKDWTS